MTDALARLLPWTGPEDKPCFLVGDGTGYVSRVADAMEAAQMAMAAELIAEARRVLAGRKWTSGELHLLTVELTEFAPRREEPGRAPGRAGGARTEQTRNLCRGRSGWCRGRSDDVRAHRGAGSGSRGS